VKTSTVVLVLLGLVALYLFTRPAPVQQPTSLLGSILGGINGAAAGAGIFGNQAPGYTNNTGSGGMW
jgi:hypothetical protein